MQDGLEDKMLWSKEKKGLISVLIIESQIDLISFIGFMHTSGRLYVIG